MIQYKEGIPFLQIENINRTPVKYENVQTQPIVFNEGESLNEGVDTYIPTYSTGVRTYNIGSNPQYEEVDTKEDNTQKEDKKVQETKQNPKQETKQTDSKNSTIQNIINTARKFVGGKYVSGGYRPESGGFDCSGLLYYAFNQNGVKLSRATYDIFKQGQEIKDIKDVQPGDIICTPGNGKTKKHVKMVSKIVDGTIYVIEAKGRNYGIVEHKLAKTNNIITIRRMFGTTKARLGTKLVRKVMYINKRF